MIVSFTCAGFLPVVFIGCLMLVCMKTGLSVFRNLDTIGKGANLTIHCLSRSLERFRLRHEKYPEVLYLQVGHNYVNRCIVA